MLVGWHSKNGAIFTNFQPSIDRFSPLKMQMTWQWLSHFRREREKVGGERERGWIGVEA